MTALKKAESSIFAAKFLSHSIYFSFMKIPVVGVGAGGATVADNIARKELCTELVMLDVKEGLAEGKAQDMMQTATLLGFDTKITGSTNDYSKTANSDVVLITSGIPRLSLIH